MGRPAGLHWFTQFFRSLAEIEISSQRVTEPQFNTYFAKIFQYY